VHPVDTANRPERALLVGLALSDRERWEKNESLDELAQLAATAGAEVVEKILQTRRRPDPAYLIGKGKVQALARAAAEISIDLLIFDQELSPAQERNLEEETKTRVIDRSELIMDIFAIHARTKAAKIQVELAQLNYQLPRLVGRGIELSRLGGGIGTRGPGETKLEVDRRRIRSRIAHLKKEIESLETSRSVQRHGRADAYRITLAGYTNAGKSTLMNALSSADVTVADQLFATLDATTRQVDFGTRRDILLTDTVGFIRNLPHHLVASFHATLEETIEADLILHVVDVSHPAYRQQMTTVEQVLTELGCGEKPKLVVFNKIDQLEDEGPLDMLHSRYPVSAAVSALAGVGIETLKARIVALAEEMDREEVLFLPLDATKLLAELHRDAKVLEESFGNSRIQVRVRMDRAGLRRVQRQIAEAWARSNPEAPASMPDEPPA
jgi:GTP-binding protein HflX